jgi:putative thioredoxin
MAFEMQDFRRDVVEASRTTPIVIDFWAEWCGPCRVLGPVLEKLATEAKGKWKLVKIDTEQHPQIAAQFQIRSIPAVKMVHNGAIVAEFVGALPEAQIRKWLDQHLPADPGKSDAEGHLNQLLETGDRAAAREVVAELYAAEPQSKELAAKLAMLCIPDRIEDARVLLGVFKDEPKYDIEKESVVFYEYVRGLPESATFDGNEMAVDHYLKGCRALRDGDFETALSSFIDSMMRDRSVDEDGARRGCVAIFSFLGELHPLTKAWRRRFSMALY